ncbi:response regulator [Cryptosporangium aurantiacum]|uniref:Two component transcriptional regulator, LuxR family n=1 Tax=Cryptosporangium aurantiacum TaxID=134849 RepID=A0A1M7RIY2_9ACTN|nr:response regulator transcription factor [Cryptosporangium aurantiacum]SHN46038.1 two component transcriptional regulator, LuxR family [Cryptosporangium aurantiacum]
MTTVRVLVVDDQRLVREGVASLLALEEDITVVGTAADAREAVAEAVAQQPDVILMDVRMPSSPASPAHPPVPGAIPDLGGVEATAAVRRRAPGCRVLMLTTFDDEEYVVRALRAGASGYLLKDLPAAELARAVRMAHAGVDQFDPAVTARLLAALDRGGSLPVSHGLTLTPREVDVLRLLARGATNREIAAALVVSEGTVKNHVSNILSRLGLRDRTQAALYARDHGLA